jgi:diguanylate cyclase (GGDEF)-like protein/PAS domain S-box-containing protein
LQKLVASGGNAANMNNSTKTDLSSYRPEDDKIIFPAAERPNSLNNSNIISGTNFYTLFESASDGIFLLDGDKIVDCNNKTMEMFACSREQIINSSLEKFLPPMQSDGSDSQKKIRQIIDNALHGESQFFEWRLCQSNNITFDAEVSFNCLELKGKMILHCIVRDVTERKREEEFYKTLAISSPVGIYILRDGKFRFANPKFEEFVGYGNDELMGMESSSLIHPDDQAAARENAVKMLKMQRIKPYEFRTITKSGEIKWAMETAIPIFYDGKREILANYVDIDDRKKAEEALRASEERYRTILENIEDGYYEIDLKGRMTFFNESCRKIFGYTNEELKGMGYRQFIDHDTAKKLGKLGVKVYETGQPEKCSDFEIISKSGLKKQIEISLSLMRGLSGHPIGFRGIVRDIDDRKKAESTILHMAYHDALTGLPNRLLFNDRLNVAISVAQRSNKKFAVMMLDLDEFKRINDSLGHDIGDLLLQSVGNRLRGHLRKSDTVARMGGDEFMLLLPEITQREDAEIIAGKIVKSFQRAFILKNHELRITASIGIAIYPDAGVDFDTLKKNSDVAMYKVKEKGRDNFKSYDSMME